MVNSTGTADVGNGPNSTQATAASPILDEVDYSPMVNYSIWLMTVTAFIFLVLRVYCKGVHKRQLWWDDHVLVVSWVS